MPYGNREGPDQTALQRSLIRTFAVRRYILPYPQFDSIFGTGQNIRLRRLIWDFAVRKCPKTLFFFWRGPIMLISFTIGAV